MGTFLRIYDGTGRPRGILSHHSKLQVQSILNEAGVVTFDYPRAAPVSELLDLPLGYITVVEDGAELAEWFVLEDDREDQADEAGPGRLITVSARGTLSVLDQAIVYPQDHFPGRNPNGMTPEFSFTKATPGTIITTLLERARNRGALTGVGYSTFSATNDSYGNPWPEKFDVTYKTGLDLYDVVGAMVDNGWIDVRMDRLELKIAVPKTQSTNRPDVVLRLGQNVMEGPRKRSRRGLTTTMLAVGAEQNIVESVDTAAANALGRREGYIGDGRMTSSGSLGVLSRNTLSQRNAISEGVTVKVALDLDEGRASEPWPYTGVRWPRPGRDFQVGDFIRYDQRRRSETELEPMRVRTFTWGWSNARAGRTCKIELNDLFLEASIKTARQVQGIVNGSKGSSAPPKEPPAPTPPPPPDTTIPLAPVGLTLASALYQDGNEWRVVLTVKWDKVTKNTDASAYTDHGSYFTSYRTSYKGGTFTPWGVDQSTLENTAVFDNLPPGVTLQARVRAQDQSGKTSPATESGQITLVVDTTPPPQPSTPTLEDVLGTLRIGWDGLSTTGAVMPFDFERTEVHVSGEAEFTPTDETLREVFAVKGITSAESLGSGRAAYARLVAVDRSGNRSTPSTTRGPIYPKAIGAASIGDEEIGFKQLAFKDAGNLVADGSFETERGRAYITQQVSGAKWVPVNGGADASHGRWFMRHTFTGAPGVTFVRLTEAIPFKPNVTEKWLVRFAVRFSTGVPAAKGMRLTLRSSDRDGVTLPSPYYEVNTTRSGQWLVFSGFLYFATPNPATASVEFTLDLDDSVAAGQTVDVDSVEVRRVVATEIIDDLAVTNAKIGLLAVDDAKIANLNVGKIVSGLLYADVTVSGSIRTASTGPRVVLDGTGLSVYSAQERTGFWNAATGDVNMVGTYRTYANNGRSVVLSADLGRVSGQAANQAGIVFNNTIAGLRRGQIYDDGNAMRFDSPAFDNGVFRGSSLGVDSRGVFMYTGGGSSLSGGLASFELRNDSVWVLGQALDRGGRVSGGPGFWTIETQNGGAYADGNQNGSWRHGTVGNVGTAVAGSTSTWRLGFTGNNAFVEGLASGQVVIGDTRAGGSYLRLQPLDFVMTTDTCALFTRSSGLFLQGGYADDSVKVQLRPGTIMRVSGGSGLYVDGDLAARNKQFRIDHPLDDDRLLVHGSTESPHPGVHYWGQGVIGDDGRARVDLPGYFEALTLPESRAVLVTPIGEPAAMAASAISSGGFVVRGPAGSQFSWLVQAVRSDVAFDVEPLRSQTVEVDSPPETPPGEPDEPDEPPRPLALTAGGEPEAGATATPLPPLAAPHTPTG